MLQVTNTIMRIVIIIDKLINPRKLEFDSRTHCFQNKPCIETKDLSVPHT